MSKRILITGANGLVGTALRRFLHGRHYHELFDLSVYCIRICNFPNTDECMSDFEPGTNRWLSTRDMAELTACCIEAPHPQFGIIYGVSKGAEKKWDITNAKELVRWEPQDDGIRRNRQ